MDREPAERSPQSPEATRRVLQLIDFLSAYDAQKNPPVRDFRQHSPYLLLDGDLPDVPGVVLTPSSEVWLSVEFLSVPPRPAIPARITDIVVLDDAGLGDERRPQIDLSTGPGQKLVERAQSWIDETWEPWAQRSRQTRAAKELYRRLFEQREMLRADRETYELVWGFGRVRFGHTSPAKVDHPILTIGAEIDVAVSSGRLTVRPAGGLEVEPYFLAGLDIADRAGFIALRDVVSSAETMMDPWDRTEMRNLLRQLIRTIDHGGGFADEASIGSDAAVIDDSWALFLRRRRPDYQGFLDDLRSLYRGGAQPPDPLKALVIDSPSTLVAEAVTGEGSGADVKAPNGAAEPEELLLPLPSNEEQRRILDLVRHRPGVTVQGPPGTGKSHTIANIISHYVAHGKRVLVVAEKEQALTVLAEKIPEGIRDLTVSVLGADEDGRRRLEASIGQIQTRVAAIDRVHADEVIERLETQLALIDADTERVTEDLLEARRTETNPLEGAWAAGERPTPAKAARWLAASEDTLGYIGDPVWPGTTPPLNADEVAELGSLLIDVGMVRARASLADLPDPSRIPTGPELAEILAQTRSVSTRVDELPPGAVNWDALLDAPSGLVVDLQTAVDRERDWLLKASGGWVSELIEQMSDPLLREQWTTFADECRADRERLLGLATVFESHEVIVPAEPAADFRAALAEAGERLFSKGRLGLGPTGRRAKWAVSLCRVDGHPPATPGEVDLCLAKLDLEQGRRTLVTRWANRSNRLDLPPLDSDQPELAIGDELDLIDRAATSEQRWQDIGSQCDRLGIATAPHPDHDELARLKEVLEVVEHAQRLRHAEVTRQELGSALEAGQATANPSPLWARLSEALAAEEIDAWEEARSELVELGGVAVRAGRLMTLHDRLAADAPDLARALVDDPRLATEMGDIELAWQWAQLDQELARLHASTDPTELQRELDQLTERRRRTVTELVSERAWRRLADRIGDAERQALNSYLQAVKRYGKTGGRFAPRWLAQIRAALNESKDAVPVWIMPTNRALTSFRPDATPRFDVLVIDEASQLGQEALPLLSLATSTIVVGDDKQTSPENVGLQREPVFDLLEEYLSEIPKYKVLFDPDASLYDLAFQKFPDVVMLTEHFRSLPEIIGFSNAFAYDQQIVPLRDRAPAPDWVPVGLIETENAVRVRDVNPAEVDAVTELIARIHADPAYDGMTFGVISLLGTDQSKQIWRRLFDVIGPEAIQDRRIRCGEPASFQGDERDVIVISIVATADPDDPSARIGAMTSRAAQRRFNVAASRARNQLWVVHSAPADAFADGDWRGDLIRYCESLPSAARPTPSEMLERCESGFERDLVTSVLDRGHASLRTQHQVGRYRIDVVLEDGDNRLAVECDGDQWLGEEAWRRDRARQQVLERAGWTFERVRASAFYRHAEETLDRLLGRLTGTEPKPAPRRSAAGSQGRLGQAQAAVAAAEAEAEAVGRVELAPYVPWQPVALPAPGEADDEQLIDGLVAIVDAEGPVHAGRAFRLYLEASGGTRMTRTVQDSLSDALAAAVERGLMATVDDAHVGTADQTVFRPGRGPVAIRELGPRQLYDVPRSELRAIVARLGLLDDPEEARVALRDLLGFARLSKNVVTYLDEAMAAG